MRLRILPGKRPVDESNERLDRTHEADDENQRTGQPDRRELVVTYSCSLGQNLCELKHQERKEERKYPDPAFPVQTVELGPCHRRTDCMSGRVEDQDGGDRTLNIEFQVLPNTPGTGTRFGQFRDLAGTQAQKNRLHQRAHGGDEKRSQNGNDKQPHGVSS